MFKRLTHLSIKKRTLTGFFSLILLLVLLSSISLYSLQILSRNTQALYEHSFSISHYSWRIQNGFNTLEREMYKIIVSNSTSSIFQTTADLLSAIQNLRNLTDQDSPYWIELDILQEQLNNLKTIHQSILETSLAGDQDLALSILAQDYAPTITRAHTAAQTLTNYADTSAQAWLARTVKIKNIVFTFIILIVLISILSGLYISFSITQSITVPLNLFKQCLTDFSKGHLNISIPYKNKDEIGELGMYLAHSTTILKDYIENISYTLSLLAKGHLDITLDTHYQGDFQAIEASIVHIINSLNYVLNHIYLATQNVSDNALQVLSGSKLLIQKNMHQKELTHHLLHTVQKVSAKATENALSAHALQQMSLDMSQFIEKGSEHIHQLTGAMTDIEQASLSIQNIVQVIDHIASESHLLALNATIEAARLGNQGRSFAVIAKEMQELSVKSSAAVKETSTLIETCLVTSSHGTTIVHETTDFLNLLLTKLGATTQPVQSITYASKEQTRTLHNIQVDIEEIAKITHTASTFALESSDIAELLAAQSQELKTLLDQFTFRPL